MIGSVNSEARNLSGQSQHEPLRQAATELEITFLDEMLKSAGFGAPQSAFGGGAGEEQFASLLRTEQARRMVEGGGIGLAEALFDYLVERHDDGTNV
ncbi:rod-binding protein [Arenibacterium halophilum]|uniref:Chemotaxis protein chel n=1 Tax=Arenibacterium halophilum TaxID=2583821 RepID=A0ABY2X656_9RHOB|nr:rod-binding protein [Arenibacterium halophilum]TMV10627.1 chemotaxis protein chel [Arenibacterium halophilum]